MIPHAYSDQGHRGICDICDQPSVRHAAAAPPEPPLGACPHGLVPKNCWECRSAAPSGLPPLNRPILDAIEFTANHEKGPTVTITKAQMGYLLQVVYWYARLSEGSGATEPER